MFLNDTERKLIRILFNRNGHQNVRIFIPELCRLAQREVGQIRKALEKLRDEQLIEWNEPMNFVKVIPGWEGYVNTLQNPIRLGK